MNLPLIEASNVTHNYGSTSVLRNLNLRVERGSIYGFLGRNGAGKSTFLRLLAGLAAPDQGRVRVLGVDPTQWAPSVQARCGYMADTQILPSTMRASALLAWTARLYPQWDSGLVQRLTATFQLDLKKKIQHFSLGQQRQLAFILALAQQPELLLLDEPAANLDTAARRAFLDEMLLLLRKENKTVFFSTHILTDVERVADHIGILADGQMRISEPLDDLKETVREIRFFWSKPEPPPVTLTQAYRSQSGPGEVLATLRISLQDPAQVAQAAGCQFETRTLNLEDLFIQLTHSPGESL